MSAPLRVDGKVKYFTYLSKHEKGYEGRTFLISDTVYSFLTPASTLWAPKPFTSERGAGTSGEACSILSDKNSRAALLEFDRAHKSLEILLT